VVRKNALAPIKKDFGLGFLRLVIKLYQGLKKVSNLFDDCYQPDDNFSKERLSRGAIRVRTVSTSTTIKSARARAKVCRSLKLTDNNHPRRNIT